MSKRIIGAWMALCVVLSPAIPFSAGQDPDKGRVLTIGENRKPQQSVFLQKDLVVGLNNEDEDFLFSEILDVQVDREGNIYVADMKDARIKIFDRDGGNLRIIGKRGQGPGEIQGVGGISPAGENEIMVTDPGNRRLSFFSTQGEWKRSLPMGTHMIGKAVMDAAGDIVAQVVIFDEGMVQEIVKFDDEINPLFSIASLMEDGGDDVLRPLRPRLAYGVTQDGHVVWGISSAYEIHVRDSQGRRQDKIVREARPVVMSKTRQQEIEKRFAGRIPPHVRIEYPPSFPYFSHFIVEPNGRIYVRTYQRNENGEHLHDVLNVRGEFLAQFALPENEHIAAAGNNKLYCYIRENEDGIPLVVRYDMRWSEHGDTKK
jgi:hypothetical protein